MSSPRLLASGVALAACVAVVATASAAPAPMPVQTTPKAGAKVSSNARPTFSWSVPGMAPGMRTYLTFAFGKDTARRQALPNERAPSSLSGESAKYKLNEWLLAGSYSWTAHVVGFDATGAPLEPVELDRAFNVPLVLRFGKVKLTRRGGSASIQTEVFSNAVITSISYEIRENDRVIYKKKEKVDQRIYARGGQPRNIASKGTGLLNTCTCRPGARLVYTVILGSEGVSKSRTLRLTM